MGKIRVKTLGIDEIEKQEKKESKLRKEHKKTAKVPELKGEEHVIEVEPTEEKTKKLEEASKTAEKPEQKEAKKETKKKTITRKRSRRYQVVAKMVENKSYSISQALELLPKLKLSKFDETVELHINTIEKGISGTLTLPHGTGKKIRVVIANPSKDPKEFDVLLKKIENGKIDFDVLLATPDAMPKLARVARILGPKGLMPNPKNGTITQKPDEMIKKYEGGQISFKTESVAPIIHIIVGKLSFGEEKLLENIKTVIATIQPPKIKKITLKSTMSPGIKVNLS